MDATCDSCDASVQISDPYGQVGLVLCADCNGGLAIAGPGGIAQQPDGSWPPAPADPFIYEEN